MNDINFNEILFNVLSTKTETKNLIFDFAYIRFGGNFQNHINIIVAQYSWAL